MAETDHHRQPPRRSGIIGTEFVAKSTPDGYTLLHGGNHIVTMNQFLFRTLPYDAERSFEPITLVSRGPAIVLTHPAVPVKTLAELIALGKAKPGQLAYGSPGTGSTGHIMGEMFKTKAGVDLLHVPCKGSAPLITDLVGGQIQLAFDYALSAGEQVKAGKLRALAITGPKRLPFLPDVPTAAEAGLPEFEWITWHGVFAPAGTPKSIIDKLSVEIARILQNPQEQADAAQLGSELGGITPEEFREFIKAETVKWGNAVKISGAKLE